MENQKEEKRESFGVQQIAAVLELVIEQQEGSQAMKKSLAHPMDKAQKNAVNGYNPDGDE